MRAVVAVFLLAACGNKQNQDGLPPATEWRSDDPTVQAPPLANKPRGAPSNDPHAGVLGGGGGGDPHAGIPGAPPLTGNEGMGGGGGDDDDGDAVDPSDPHAGVPGAPPIAGGGGNNPHAGAGVDVTQLGLQSPDPARAIDPNRRIQGKITLAANVKDKVTAGAAVFLMVRKSGPDGQPIGAPIAVDRVTWSADGMAFELSEKNAMVQGAPDLVGELVVMARVDQDQDAMTKQPGDVTGMAKVKIPASGVVLQLDKILP